MGFLKRIFESDNSRSLRKLQKIVDEVNALEGHFKEMSDSELQAQTNIFKERLKNGETLNDILPEAYALVREASTRVLKMRHFDVQIMGGIALHQGRIAEMKTGEGKTLVATLPCYLNALSGNGVHVVTVNEFLARTQAEQMAKLFNFLGLTVGINLSGMSPAQKKKVYACDITYSTNNELGFDYLRDNMARSKGERCQRGQNFAIVDEVDSILIDEARTPLIISGPGTKPSSTYLSTNAFVKKLTKDEDFEIDEEFKKINLTEVGTSKAEKYFKINDMSDLENMELAHYISQALRANYMMKLDKDYIIKDGEILIVDEFTGRVMQGRRYSDGLHQAIEAKEGVEIKNENKTYATITFQNYFRIYKKLSGMTGTAKTEELEFNKIYNLDVVCIPTNLPLIRKDYNDLIFTTVNGKIRAIIEDVKHCYEEGQPVLIGTVSVEKSEELSHAFRAQRIPHNVLNAKNHEQESEIVAQAGRYKAVTISTNMAGRGTDILLGGNPDYMAKKRLREIGYEETEIIDATGYIVPTDPKLLKIKEEYNKYYADFKRITDAEKEKVINAGGLRIIGTERHESRRIDNQLRGRAGRQGDIGSSIFYISLQDDLARIFGGDRLFRIASSFNLDEDQPFSLKLLTNQIENAQKKIEINNFSARKNVIRYDDVMNKQREIIYGERNKVLDGQDVTEEIHGMFEEMANKIAHEYLDADKPYFDWNLEPINKALEEKLFPKGTELLTESTVDDMEISDVANYIYKCVLDRYENKKDEARKIGFPYEELERNVLLSVVDKYWMEQIDAMTILKNEIGLRAYGQQDPIIAYKKEGFDMFDEMIGKIREETALILLNCTIEVNMKPMPASPKPIIVTEGTSKSAKSDKTPNRNDPCPCGSGKKYKNCCGKDEQ